LILPKLEVNKNVTGRRKKKKVLFVYFWVFNGGIQMGSDV